MPSFVTFSGNTFTIAPPLTEVNGATYPISVSIFDGAMTTTSSFNVIVAVPPKFVIIPLPAQTVSVGAIFSFTPSIIDPGNLPMTITVSGAKPIWMI